MVIIDDKTQANNILNGVTNLYAAVVLGDENKPLLTFGRTHQVQQDCRNM